MTAQGHEDAFRRLGPSDRCRLRQETFAGTSGNGRGAPLADLPMLATFSEIGGYASVSATEARSAWTISGSNLEGLPLSAT